MAKKNDHLGLVAEIKRREEELVRIKEQVKDKLEAQVKQLMMQIEEMGFPLPKFIIDAVNKRAPRPSLVRKRAGNRGRKQRSCKLCVRLGMEQFATGHIERGHSKWLERQTPDIQRRYRRSLSKKQSDLASDVPGRGT